MIVNPYKIPKDYALDIDATYWQKLYIHIALEKAGYDMFAKTKDRLARKKLGVINQGPYTNLVKGSIIYHKDKICCHFSTSSSILKPFEWWYSRMKNPKWSKDTFLDEQLKNLEK